ncbi:MAG: peptidoglycan-binding protein [Candidatus Methylomirabilales bacterium]
MRRVAAFSLTILALAVSAVWAQAPTAPDGTITQAPVVEVRDLPLEEVYGVQQQLQAAGFNPGPINGLGVERTQEAVKQFQRTKGFRVTGQLDPTTRAALRSISGIAAPHEASEQ